MLVKEVQHMRGGKVEMAAKFFHLKFACQILGKQKIQGRKHPLISAFLLEICQFRNALDDCGP